MHRAARDDYRFSALIMGVVESAPFRMRMVQPEVEAAEEIARE